jgi:hypothetical protein
MLIRSAFAPAAAEPVEEVLEIMARSGQGTLACHAVMSLDRPEWKG